VERLAMQTELMEKIDKRNRKPEPVTPFSIGDMVKVSVKVKEAGKERIQAFSGTVIGRKGTGATATFTVRRVSFGIGVERVFPTHSPNITSIDVSRSSKVRRAKLYYLRDRAGKTARLKTAKVL
jgi:large subunit ribosomal protein L19